ncbi:MAG: hypothetical protein DRG59_08070 [Deltaproteobacteria bacterium]|nr:MAG: hypothetical protein DRG59_08070 [Deltaproteobacteria bacterium]
MVEKDQDLTKYVGERIRKYRLRRKLSQRDMGKLLGIPYQRYQKYEVGEIRLPAEMLLKIGQVLDVSLDTLMYDENFPDEAIKYVRKVRKLRERQFNAAKLIHMIIFFGTMCRLNKTKLNKLLFYADFLHYKEHGKPISNVPYVKLPHGPAPESYNAILGILEGTGHIEITEVVLNKGKGVIEEQITAVRPFDQKLFDEKELEILRKVALHLGGKTGAELSELAHNEPFWEEHGLGKPIDYELAKKLKVEL